jgi:hypothetical protein
MTHDKYTHEGNSFPSYFGSKNKSVAMLTATNPRPIEVIYHTERERTYRFRFSVCQVVLKN